MQGSCRRESIQRTSRGSVSRGGAVRGSPTARLYGDSSLCINSDVKLYMMTTLRIFDLVRKRVLVSRDSARTIQPQLVAPLADGLGELVLDLSDVDGLTPSFFDETLSIVEEALSARPESLVRLTVKNPPTALSNKFRAVGRVHGLTVEDSEGIGWILERERTEPNAK